VVASSSTLGARMSSISNNGQFVTPQTGVRVAVTG
jgi:hypothetical protein